MSRLKDECRFIFITSRANVHSETARPEAAKSTSIPGLWIIVSASSHPKCERCWHRRPEVNTNMEYPGICDRCIENIAGEGEVRRYA